MLLNLKMNKYLKKPNCDLEESAHKSKKTKIYDYFDKNEEFTFETTNTTNLKESIILLIKYNSPRIGLLNIKSKSTCWEKFDKISLDNIMTDYAKCKSCSNVIKCDRNTGTYN